jgi:Zn-dependent M28 family amino/carboxypeptidase
VLAFLDNKAPYTIVIGAHYDHLGLGHDKNSMDANPDGKTHNGADDNASGTAGVLELANYFSNNKKTEGFNFLFMCYSGEELGLIGSKKWCDDPSLPLEKINYMINMDMIGRLNDSSKKLIVYGVGTSPVWVPIIDSIRSNFSIKKDSSGIGPSDQTSFYLKNIPVLHFFTGQHEDYHKPSDDADKINYEGEAAVLEYIIRVINATGKSDKLAFLKTRNPDTGKTSFKVTLGVMPDYAFEGKGLKIDGVTDGKPASKAGMQKGDIVIKLGDTEVNDIQEYMKGLSRHKKGDTVPVKILRDGKEMELKVTF